MKVNQSLIISIVIILACRAANHFVWVEYAKPLLFSYQAELIPQSILIESDSGVVGNFRKSLNQFTKDYCSTFSYLPWVNCQDTHITKAGIPYLWNLNDEWELVLCVIELVALGFLTYNQRQWIALDVFFFQMNGLFYGSFPSFLSTLLSLLQEILKQWVDFPMKDSLAIIREWEPRILPLLLVIPIWYYIKSNSLDQNIISSITSSFNTIVPLLGIGFHVLSVQLFETKKVGMALTAAVLFGYYFFIPKIQNLVLAPIASKVVKQDSSTEKTNGKSQNVVGSPKPPRTNSAVVPNGSSVGGLSNGKK